uniref:Transmembrane p24 trafficking protein 1 n=2 Tax=Canis lupus familiaris TaxID=9615 RepID=A0A8P0TTI0_CANLF
GGRSPADPGRRVHVPAARGEEAVFLSVCAGQCKPRDRVPGDRRCWTGRGFHPGEPSGRAAGQRVPQGRWGAHVSSVPLSVWVQFQLWPSLVASGYHLLCLSESGSCASVCLSPRVEPTEAGDYKLCFDNSFSTISDKLVFFELIFDSLQDDEEVEGWAEAVEPEEMLDVKMEDIKESIETMKTRLERSIQMLTLLRAFEARDRNLQEGNLERVNFWSAVNVAVLLLVAVLQVCTLKRFFQDKRPVPT